MSGLACVSCPHSSSRPVNCIPQVPHGAVNVVMCLSSSEDGVGKNGENVEGVKLRRIILVEVNVMGRMNSSGVVGWMGKVWKGSGGWCG